MLSKKWEKALADVEGPEVVDFDRVFCLLRYREGAKILIRDRKRC